MLFRNCAGKRLHKNKQYFEFEKCILNERYSCGRFLFIRTRKGVTMADNAKARSVALFASEISPKLHFREFQTVVFRFFQIIYISNVYIIF